MARTKPIVNQRELRFVGMSRSGNHAIIHWVLNHLEGRVCFLNCAEPRSNPFATARPRSEGGETYLSSFPLDLQAETAGRHAPKDHLLYSYEDCYLGMVADARSEAEHDNWVGRSAERRDVLVLRDPFNLFASRRASGMYEERRRGGGPNLVTRAQAGRIWKQHAREFLKPGTHLKRSPLVISFNRWSSDPAYRKRIAEELQLTFTDKGFDAVPTTAGGSSFDGLRYNGTAQDMRVSSRWRHFAHDLDFWRQFDEQTRSLAEKIFGALPPPATKAPIERRPLQGSPTSAA